MKKNIKIRLEYKIMFVAAILSVVMVPMILIFVLFPTYNLAGSELGSSTASTEINSIIVLSNIFNAILILLIVTSILSGLVGVYKDAKTKPKP